MPLLTVLKEREKRAKILRQDAFSEARRLASLLKERFTFESIYICGSLLSGRFGYHSDIDMVIKGMRLENFFKAYALLIKTSRYEIDLKPFEDLPEDFKKNVITGGMKIG